MFKMTKGDLAAKSNTQLFALFQEASKGLIAATSDIASAQSLLAMIRAESTHPIGAALSACGDSAIFGAWTKQATM